MVIFSDCAECKNAMLSVNEWPKCKAFPQGIPKEVYFDVEDKDGKECANGFGFVPDDDCVWRTRQHDSNV